MSYEEGVHWAEKTRIATPAVSRWADLARGANAFAAKWFGYSSNTWARRIYLPPGRMLKLDARSAPGPIAIAAAGVT
jgi:hypothetical protein